MKIDAMIENGMYLGVSPFNINERHVPEDTDYFIEEDEDDGC